MALPTHFECHTARTVDLTPQDLAQMREFLSLAFDGDFEEADWLHALGGTHVWITDAGDGGRILCHGSVVPRSIVFGDRRLETGYVEAVATEARLRRKGLGSSVMERLADVIHKQYSMGVLSSGEHRFYESLGWTLWRGPSHVEDPEQGIVPTPDDDGGIMVLSSSSCFSGLDVDARIVADWRPGDIW
jgi:aminoglycoside 2'-N-acetyltransferase I